MTKDNGKPQPPQPPQSSQSSQPAQVEKARTEKAIVSDIFVRHQTYPEASGIFSYQGRLPEDMSRDCLVVMDTNALLVLYGTGGSSLAAVKSVYQRLAEAHRLIVPGQVAREFADRRATKLAELFHQIAGKRNTQILNAGEQYPLLQDSDVYKALLEKEKRLLRRICGCTRGTATAGLKRPSRGHAGLQRSGSSIPA